MAVYVDNLMHPYGRLVLSHMVADTPEELAAMAESIDLRPKFLQYAGTPKEHYDVSLKKRELALKAGAQEITLQELGRMMIARRAPKETHE